MSQNLMLAWSFSAIQLTLRGYQKVECPKVCMLVQKLQSDNKKQVPLGSDESYQRDCSLKLSLYVKKIYQISNAEGPVRQIQDP